MMPLHIHADIESFSACDLKQCGGHRYANDASTEILCIGVAEDDDEPVIWIAPRWHAGLPWYTQAKYEKATGILKRMGDPSVKVFAHNSTSFETPMLDALFTKTTGLPPPAHHQWRCTQAMARRAALPPSLAKCAEALKLPQQKDTRGAALIRKFCIPQTFSFKPTKPQKKEFLRRGITLDEAESEARAAFKPRILPTDEPEAFRELCEYCKTDVVVERGVGRALKHFELDRDPFVLETFQVDIDINSRGFPVNLGALANAKEMVTEVVADAEEEFRRHTGVKHTQDKAFKKWLREHGCTSLPDLTSETLDAFIEREDFDETSEVGRALLIRQKVSFAATKKIEAMLKCHGPHDNHVRGTLIWHGTGPGRWAAEKVQPHNFKKPDQKLVRAVSAIANGFMDSDEVLEWLTASAYADISGGCSVSHIESLYGPFLSVLSSCIRHFIQDHRGPMCNADYSAIEARVLSWHAKEEWRMEVFRTHGKIYEMCASQMFKVPMDQVSKSLRQKGKVSELACGYQGGVGALIVMGALKMGLKEEELKPLVDTWRAANPKIVEFWGNLDTAARSAITNPGRLFCVGHLGFRYAQTAGIPYLFMVLPSGRKIAYPYPKIEATAMWTEDGKRIRRVAPTSEDVARAQKADRKGLWMPDGITYWGQIKTEKGGKSTQWGRVSLSPGVMAENATMGSATDVMGVGLINAHRAGYKIYTTVHDEALAAYEPQRGQSLEGFIECLTDMPAWAKGLPVKADGAIVPYYKK